MRVRLWKHWMGLGLMLAALVSGCGKESNEAKIESVSDARPSPPRTDVLTETPTPTTTPAHFNTVPTHFDDIRLPDGVLLDGTLLVQRDAAIYHVGWDGTPPQLMNEDMEWGDLSIAPDHQHIAYLFQTPDVDPGPTPPPDAMVYIPPPTSLAILDLTSGESRLIYASEGGLSLMGWSPDGNWLAFTEFIYPPYDPALVATSEFGDGFTFYQARPETNLLAASLQPDDPVARLDGGSNALWLMDNTLLAMVEISGEGMLIQDVYQLLPDENQALPLEIEQAWQLANVFYNIEFRPSAQRILDEFGLTLGPVMEDNRYYYNRAISPDGSMYVEATTSSSPVPMGTEAPACALHNIVLRGLERAILPEPIVVLDKGNVVGVSHLAWLPVEAAETPETAENDPEAVELVYLVRTSATCEWDNFETTMVHRLPDGTIEEIVTVTTGVIVDVLVPPQSRVVLWVWQDQETAQSTLNLYDVASGENYVLAQSDGALFGAMWWVG